MTRNTCSCRVQNRARIPGVGRDGGHRLEGQGCADVCLEFAAASLPAVCYVLFGPILKGYHSQNFLTTGLPPNLSLYTRRGCQALIPSQLLRWRACDSLSNTAHVFNRSISVEGGLFLDFVPQGFGPLCTQRTGYIGYFPHSQPKAFFDPSVLL